MENLRAGVMLDTGEEEVELSDAECAPSESDDAEEFELERERDSERTSSRLTLLALRSRRTVASSLMCSLNFDSTIFVVVER